MQELFGAVGAAVELKRETLRREATVFPKAEQEMNQPYQDSPQPRKPISESYLPPHDEAVACVWWAEAAISERQAKLTTKTDPMDLITQQKLKLNKDTLWRRFVHT